MSQALRERLERAKTSLEQFASDLDAKTSGPDAADQEQLVKRVEEIKTLSALLKAMNSATSALGDTSVFLQSLGDAPTAAVKTLEDVERTPDGRIGNPQGKTLGELFVESMAYKSLDGYKNADGFITQGASHFKTPPFEFDSKALVTGASATSAGAAVRNDMFAPITDLVGYRDLRVKDLVTVGSTQSDAVDYVRVDARTNNAAPFAETTNVTSSAIKAESSLTLEVVTTTVRNIAHWIPITRRAASDAGQVRMYIDNFLRYGIEEELDDQMIAGAGTGENFTGILNVSGIQSVDATTTPGAGSGIDAVLTGISKVRYTGFRRATGLVVHPDDWYSESFLTKKTTTGEYIIGDPRAGADQMATLWGLNVVVTPAVTNGTAIVGDFRQAVLWEREGIQLYVTDSHSDFFVRNVLVLLAEMRAAFGVLDPQAFCKITNL